MTTALLRLMALKRIHPYEPIQQWPQKVTATNDVNDSQCHKTDNDVRRERKRGR